MSPGLEALNKGVAALHVEGAGAVKLSVVMPGEEAGLMLNALGGDAESTTLLRCLFQAQHAIDKAPRKEPMLCAVCPMPIRGTGHGYVVVTSAVPEPQHGMAFAVCRRCGPTPEAVGVKGFQAAKRFWPDLRAAGPMAPGGRA